MIRRLWTLLFASREPPRPWIPCKVSRREFEWCICPSRDSRYFAIADEILRIRSRDGAFDVTIGVKDDPPFSILGPSRPSPNEAATRFELRGRRQKSGVGSPPAGVLRAFNTWGSV